MLATYRGHSVPFYAASMGANYAIASLVFFGKSLSSFLPYAMLCLSMSCFFGVFDGGAEESREGGVKLAPPR